MKTPKTVQIGVTLMPVACDIIAEYGDHLMVLDSVIIGVYKPEDEPIVKALVVTDVTTPKATPVKKPTVILPLETVLKRLAVGGTMSLKGIHTDICQYLKEPSIPEYIVRDRLSALVKRGEVMRVSVEGQASKPYRCATQRGKTPPQEVVSEMAEYTDNV